jgi:hypothetical protein
MAKNEIHARISPQLMEALRRICSDKSCNLSDATRAALVLYVDVYECPNLFEQHRLSKSENTLEIGLIGASLDTTKATPDLLDELVSDNDSVVQLIEQELEVFFARCRDECEPEDGELYWFWFESSWQYDADSPNNWCPAKRFRSQEDAIRDCLKKKLTKLVNVNALTETLLPSPKTTHESSEDSIIDW